MKANERIVRRYINTHPAEAARSLEKLPAQRIAGTLDTLDNVATVNMFTHMLPHAVASSLPYMDEHKAAEALGEAAPNTSARILKATHYQTAQTLLGHLESDTSLRIKRLLSYRPGTVGAAMDTISLALTEEMTVGEAIKHIQRYHGDSADDIPVVDGSHKLRGTINITQLLKSGHNQPLKNLTATGAATLPARMKLDTALGYDAWHSRRQLPVVESDNTLVGSLAYKTLLAATGSAQSVPFHTDILSTIFSVTHLYWIALSEIINTFTRQHRDR